MNGERKDIKIVDKKTALAKAEHFCAYQERSQQEVRDKLYSYGLYSADVEELIAELIASNFLNEERFATAYAQGKFRMKQWGRAKIRQGLKLKGVPDGIIRKSLAKINGDDYLITLKLLLEKRASSMKEPDTFKMRQKLLQYAMSRGYESDLIFDVLKSNGLE